jgi:S-adenosylmethionine:tRNA ribosyltransferase-isomerase
MNTSDFDYFLPEELIAQQPLANRTDSRMLVLDRRSGSIDHASVNDIGEYLEPGDLLVFNNTRVFPARTRGVRPDTGGKAELVFVRQLGAETGEVFSSEWLCICGSGSRKRKGLNLSLCGGAIRAELMAVLDQGHVQAAITTHMPIMQVLEEKGEVPLPPYIQREAGASDRSRYQTVFARQTGAVAAPTAGLHFTEELLDGLEERGLIRCEVTLHVGPGTFLPVKADAVEDHRMHSEHYVIGREGADAIGDARERGNRVTAVGTTTVRTLEGAYLAHGAIGPCEGSTDIFIYPPFDFKVVNCLLTNFHLPKSTLLMMVSAFAGRDLVLSAYREAVAMRYRFFSYGDCMLIL